MDKDKSNKIAEIIKKVNKNYKSTTLVIGSELANHETIPTPFSSLNAVMGGIPRGRFSTIAGPEHVGKGAMCVQIAAHNQHIDPNFVVMWSDFENSFDKSWAAHLGLDLDRTIFHQYTKDINTMEKMMDIALELLKTQTIDMWVIDSIGAMLPRGDIYSGKEEKSLEASNMLNLQRKMGEFYRKANVFINRDLVSGYKGCACVLIGQVYGVPTTTGVALEEVKGGNAVKHWAHLRLKMRRGPKADWPSPIKVKGLDGKVREKYPGWSCAIKIDKTRINGSESQELLIPFFYGRGFDSVLSTITAAMGLNIITRAGPYYECALLDKKIQGRDEIVKIFTQNNNLLEELGKLVDKACLEQGLIKEVNKEEESLESSEE